MTSQSNRDKRHLVALKLPETGQMNNAGMGFPAEWEEYSAEKYREMVHAELIKAGFTVTGDGEAYLPRPPEKNTLEVDRELLEQAHSTLRALSIEPEGKETLVGMQCDLVASRLWTVFHPTNTVLEQVRVSTGGSEVE